MLTYDAILDVPRELALALSRLLATERKERGTRRDTRALTCFKQAVLILRHFREPTGADALARDNNIGRATAYRYIDEGITVLSRNAPDLQNTLHHALHNSGRVILDGKLFESDRCAERKPDDDGVDLWYSGHKHRHGGNVQFIADADGEPLWVSAVEPGSVSDITAARLHALPLLSADNKAANLALRSMRSIGERAMALLVERWRLLRHTTKSPTRIGDLVKAALVLHKLEKQTR